MNKTFEKFKKFEAIGSALSQKMRENSFSSDTGKQLRTWNATETAQLAGCSVQNMRDNEKSGALPTPQKKSSDSNSKKFYTLQDINVIRKHFNTLPSKGSSKAPSIVAFTNFKGGVAKTTSAVHSAHYFARAGYRVLLIDLDSQATATSTFGFAPDEHIDKNATLLPYFLGEIDSIKSLIMKTYWEGLDLIPANLALHGIELELPVLREKALAQGEVFSLYDILHKGLLPLYPIYDYICIDCPPAINASTINALYAANGLIIPCPPEAPDIASMFQFFGMIRGILEKIPNKAYSFVKILITKHDGSKISKKITAMLRKFYGSNIFAAEMSITTVIKQARFQSESIYELSTYKGSKKTVDRALQIVDSVNEELEELVNEVWEVTAKTENET